MKKLMSIFASALFVFALASCGGDAETVAHGEEGHECNAELKGCNGYVDCTDDCAKKCCTDKVATCSDDCKKACCLGCKATDGEKGCKLLSAKYKTHSCCNDEGATLVETKTHTHDDNGPHTH